MTVENYSDKYFFDVMRVVENFHKEAIFEYDDLFNADSLIEKIKSSDDLDRQNCFLMIVNGQAQGILYGTRLRSITSGRDIFQEMIWYVNPGFRGHGLRLLNEVEKILKSQGVGIIIMAVLENSKTEKLKGLYEKMGYKKMETHYVRSL